MSNVWKTNDVRRGHSSTQARIRIQHVNLHVVQTLVQVDCVIPLDLEVLCKRQEIEGERIKGVRKASRPTKQPPNHANWSIELL